jgi:SAM-dependent methyltransferase
MADSDHNWRLWGERDPYYGVLTDPRFRKDQIEANREAFFAEGEAFIGYWMAEIDKHFGGVPRGRALDFGCGVGRLTLPLADHFEAVVGLDISQGMLEEARRNSAGRNIDFRPSDDALSQAEGTFDFVCSVIVLQHIPTARGMSILARLLERVGPGGACLIQFSTRRQHGGWSELRYRIRHGLPGGQVLMNLIERRAADTPVMQMNEYSLDAVLGHFRAQGFAEMVVRFESHGDIETATVLSRRG